MHTAQLISVIADPKYPEISVSTIQFFKDGVAIGAPDVERGLNADGLTTYCRERISQLDTDASELQSMADFIAHHTPGLVDVSPAQPTVDEIKQNEFQASLQKVRELKQQIDLGVIDETDEEYVSAVQTAKDAKEDVQK